MYKHQIPKSPAFVLDEEQVSANLQPLLALRATTGCKILYSMKALPLMHLLEFLQNRLDGLSASSLFEARMAKQVLGEGAYIHLTTPGLRPDEFPELASLCSHISFNSLSQFQRLHATGSGYAKGLRVNPKLSFAADSRYDPCRSHSKLGVDIDELFSAGLPTEVVGLHFHTVFAHNDFQPLIATINKLLPLIERSPQLEWLNIGGGYLYHSICDLEPITEIISRLRTTYDLDVYLEPGKAIVGNAGYLLTTVLDRFDSDGKTVLVLDTAVNHHPEVFEYQQQPALLEADTFGTSRQTAILAGSSCMAGDVFGEYAFKRLPEVGERLVFGNVGAYSLIKANRFNGYNLPDVYRIRAGHVHLLKQYDYADYFSQWSDKASKSSA